MNAGALDTPIARSADRAWLFSRRADLWAFGAPAAAALAIVAGARALGLDGDTPPGLWLLAVLGVDVAHVWSTLWRTYADPSEVRRRPLLYVGAPVACYAAGVALHALG